ncbi:MAG: TetR/AcrR family transcriptional regulator [Bacteroidia bacterium]|nr:TetR/AcrR family transcriptional regulator [Bacteroidia bacterium]
MAKKKVITSTDMIGFYMNYVLENNEKPKSVYNFAKANNFEESQFYNHFGNFEVLEQTIFQAFFDNTISVLEKNDEYQNLDAKNKLLSFYFTFFEMLTANRSYVVFALEGHMTDIKKIKALSKLKRSFTDYIDTLDIKTIEIKQKRLEQIQTISIQESAWLQLLLTMKFWMEDTSASFEKTDILIEKAVNASFDLMDIKPLKTVTDLGKFLFKETFQMN